MAIKFVILKSWKFIDLWQPANQIKYDSLPEALEVADQLKQIFPERKFKIRKFDDVQNTN